MVYWDYKASKFGDNLAEVSPRYNTFRESFQKIVVDLKDNIAHAGPNFKRRTK